MTKDFTGNLKGNITINPNTKNDKKMAEENIDKEAADNSFILKKKADDKKGKKVFNVYMDPDKLKELDKACKKSGHSRNELVNIMIDYCLDNLKLED